jgi:hypothetical protein
VRSVNVVVDTKPVPPVACLYTDWSSHGSPNDMFRSLRIAAGFAVAAVVVLGALVWRVLFSHVRMLVYMCTGSTHANRTLLGARRGVTPAATADAIARPHCGSPTSKPPNVFLRIATTRANRNCKHPLVVLGDSGLAGTPLLQAPLPLKQQIRRKLWRGCAPPPPACRARSSGSSPSCRCTRRARPRDVWAVCAVAYALCHSGARSFDMAQRRLGRVSKAVGGTAAAAGRSSILDATELGPD